MQIIIANMKKSQSFPDLPEAAQRVADQMNRLGSEGAPFLVLVDFELEKPIIVEIEKAAQAGIYFRFGAFGNDGEYPVDAVRSDPKLQVAPDSAFESSYGRAFDTIQYHLHRGDIYLANLTNRIPIVADIDIDQMFACAEAPYKILFKDRFAVFSPEPFVVIRGQTISTYPMKGTRRAHPHAVEYEEHALRADPKEAAEHATVVDLLRNDLSMVAESVTVNRFKFTNRIHTAADTIVQMSSEICGRLADGWQERIGSILFKMLPAGSVSGAPKREALRVIAESEKDARGYYTGVAGVFDGKSFDSTVLIRYVEKVGESLFFRSGGGITVGSSVESEYREMLQKAAIPVRREASEAQP